jgi:NAD(P)-dependent dehydrogenase (short-subunit alcohol dehydrogenase family)
MGMNVMISGCFSEFERALAGVFVREGFTVYSPGDLAVVGVGDDGADAVLYLDYLVDTTDFRDDGDNFRLLDGVDAGAVERVFRGNVLGPMAMLERVLPLLDAGEGKRLVYLSSVEASINVSTALCNYGYNMSKAALHQFVQLVRNKLASKGYTFRVFDPLTGEISPEKAAEAAFHYITRRRGSENNDTLRDDEERLVLRDALGREYGW